jgi:hypothetical protein
MPEELCEEQSRLALAALAATNRVHDANNALDRAKRQKQDTQPYALALYDAREAEWLATLALENHRKEHGCWGVGLPRSAS